MPKAIFWDMDGTLVDSEPLWGIATYELSERLGRRLTPELREITVGGSFAHTLDVAAAHAGVELRPGDYEHHKQWMYARMAQLLEGSLEPNPGIRGLLASLTAAGVPMMVTTNTERVLADACIAAVGADFFVGSIAGDEVERAKPDPEMYMEAARRVGFGPAQCLVFEDSWAGMSAASAAGCTVLGLAAEVPAGVVPFDPGRFVGAGAADVERWFSELGSSVR
ncbi:HAD family hydrolase [Corynebacterium liangguodongii]|uniref:Phosphatase n=1 Tax=Corynebacterium liangguodongii TaxID=2079535 RepID=A0A2S0WH26_9CORY|nr:HAD family phosphatase [Corynebacterium liangguodongii]AWB85070.1 phosphatase [Corynebacterium liangguodongii]PWC00306.1 HAD family phosphatase [Corynebacterium liangguodongii]